jgi:hypothetical protein
VTNADYQNFARRGSEDYAIVSNTQSRISLPLPGERLDIAFTSFGKLRERVQNTKRGLPVDCSQF